MDMIITHADASLVELRHILKPDKYDAQVSILTGATIADNDWVLELTDEVWALNPIEIGHYIYIDATEWGGRVERVEHSTATRTVTLSGVTWRGMLKRKRIEPPAGQAYYVADDEANTIIAAVISGQFGDLFEVSTDDTGVDITGSWRYVEIHDSLQTALLAEGLTLDITYSSATQKVTLSARAVVDSSADIDLSQDYGIPMISSSGRNDAYNHIIALGAGELLDRDILHVYRLTDGTITTVAPDWVGTVEDLVYIYDYNNPEDDDALLKGASDKLREFAPLSGVEIDPSEAGVDLPMGDIVGATDRLTGLSGTASVVGKVLTINRDGYKIETRVG